MAEELYFFKFNPNKAKFSLLVPNASSKIHPFKQFLINEFEPRDGMLRYETFIKNCTHNIDQISPDDLSELLDWYFELEEQFPTHLTSSDSPKSPREQMMDVGFDLFHTMEGQKTTVRLFNEITNNFESLEGTELTYNCSSELFYRFLNYAICYSGTLMLFLNRHYYKNSSTESENFEINSSIEEIVNLRSGGHLLELAQKQLAAQKLLDPKNLHDIEKSSSPLISTASMYHLFSLLKEQITGYNGRVIRVHNY